MDRHRRLRRLHLHNMGRLRRVRRSLTLSLSFYFLITILSSDSVSSLHGEIKQISK